MTEAEMAAAEYKIPDSVVARAVAGESVLLDLRSGVFFSLNGTGAFIWKQFETQARRDAILASLVDHFDVSTEAARDDLDAFLGDLRAHGLVEGG